MRGDGALSGRRERRAQRGLPAELDGELHRYIVEFVYGEVYAGDVFDLKTRVLCTVAMLACLDQQLQLAIYLRSPR